MGLRTLTGLLLAAGVTLSGGPATAGGPRVRITWRPAVPRQGDPLLVEVRPRAGLTPAGGRLLGRPLRFFPWGPGSWRALAPVAVGTGPGRHPLTITLRRRRGGAVRVTRQIRVGPGHFGTERLEVDRRFTRASGWARRAIRRDHRRVRRAFARGARRRLWRAPLVIPLEGRVTDPYGVRRTFNGQLGSRHLGLDVDGRVGDPVRALAAGRVVLARRLFQSGNTVILDHGLGLFTVYFHLSKRSVSRGDAVAAGAVVGRVGATGRATGPHLHLGVRLEGRYVSPARLLHLGLGPEPVPGAVRGGDP